MSSVSLSRSDRTGSRARSRRRYNTVVTWAIIALLALAPVPFGGITPLSWTIWGVLVGALSAVYLLLLALRREGFSIPVGAFWPALVAMALVYGFMVAQTVPLPVLFGGLPTTLSDGSQIVMPTISIAPGETILTLVRNLTYGLLFFLTVQAAADDRRRYLLLQAIVVVTVAHAIYGLAALYQFGDSVLGIPKQDYLGSATGTFLNRNHFATLLAFGAATAMLLLCGSVARRLNQRNRTLFDVADLLYLIAVVILVATVFLTNSRMGLAVTLLGIVVALGLSIARNRVLRRPVLLALPLGLVGIVLLFFQYGEGIWTRFLTTGDEFGGRFAIYESTLRLIGMRPWLGFGGGTFMEAYPITHNPFEASYVVTEKAHNTYLQLWSELGVVFGTIPMLIVAGLGLLMITRMVQGRGSWTSQATALTVIIIGATHALLDYSLEVQSVTFLFVVILGIGFAGAQVNAQERS